MVKIDTEKCVGCGACAADCFPQELELVDGKAVPRGVNCIACGHCIAVCPTDAVTLAGYNMGEVLECASLPSRLDPQVYLNHLKTRRSIRRFQNVPVTREQLELILEAGRFSPTGGNLQNVSYTVFQKELPALRTKLIDELKLMGDEAARAGQKISWYSDMWLEMYGEYHAQRKDRLFFGAGTAIVIASDSPQSACIAAAHMETMIYSLGLGMLYSGFSARAIMHSPALQKELALKENYQVYAVLVVGCPDVNYLRTVPRKSADVVWR